MLTSDGGLAPCFTGRGKLSSRVRCRDFDTIKPVSTAKSGFLRRFVQVLMHTRRKNRQTNGSPGDLCRFSICLIDRWLIYKTMFHLCKKCTNLLKARVAGVSGTLERLITRVIHRKCGKRLPTAPGNRRQARNPAAEPETCARSTRCGQWLRRRISRRQALPDGAPLHANGGLRHAGARGLARVGTQADNPGAWGVGQ